MGGQGREEIHILHKHDAVFPLSCCSAAYKDIAEEALFLSCTLHLPNENKRGIVVFFYVAHQRRKSKYLHHLAFWDIGGVASLPHQSDQTPGFPPPPPPPPNLQMDTRLFWRSSSIV